MTSINPDLKKIVDEWIDANSEDIMKGLEIRSPKSLLKYERQLLSLVMQLGAIIIAWILNTKLQDKNFQKYAKEKVMQRKSKKYKHQTDSTRPSEHCSEILSNQN